MERGEGENGEEEEEKEEKGGESHARLYVCPSGPLQAEDRCEEGVMRVRLYLLTTSEPGSPAHSHKDIVRKLLPSATHLEKVSYIKRQTENMSKTKLVRWDTKKKSVHRQEEDEQKTGKGRGKNPA